MSNIIMRDCFMKVIPPMFKSETIAYTKFGDESFYMVFKISFFSQKNLRVLSPKRCKKAGTFGYNKNATRCTPY